MKPLIFAAASNRYFEDYANVLMNSATAHGMPCCILNGGEMGDVEASNRRFLELPDLLKENKSILVVDVDSIIMAPIDVPEHFDLGIFLRTDRGDKNDKTLLSTLYVTDRAMDFALDLREMAKTAKEWGDEQGFVWELYGKYGHLRIWIIDDTFVSWKARPAPVWTGKGAVKYKNVDYRKAHNKFA